MKPQTLDPHARLERSERSSGVWGGAPAAGGNPPTTPVNRPSEDREREKKRTNGVELFTIERAFYTGDYQQVISLDISGFKDPAKLRAQVLVARANIQLGKGRDVISQLNGSTEPDLAVVKAYAEYQAGIKTGLAAVEKLIQSNSENATVQYIGGLVLVAEKKYPEALQLLGQHQGSLECVSLIIQIHLIQNRPDSAAKLVNEARKWAQDNVVFNVSEAWTNLRLGPEKAQSAFYIYEELATGGVASARSLLGQGVAQIELGRYPEGEELISEALQLEPENPEVLANAIASAILNGKDYTDYESKLEQVQRDHPSLVALKEKSDLFDKVAAKYQVA
ncbi:hypothetical protein AWJ20_920 [Sugiyamaella lignohabitans]|uniref:Uncharacterized protein n=1 Tax=Sugiyamaella lignohabitans TaxID=796027 RepID=A0A161HL27_9ASCO|nr:uncharacterized protein AWJ20_920 [Sugiyamaella lignohabitans]ANB12658.1 hypothetical protein AWJ20_920 [Sugiyamaella lignohabitans]